MTAKPPAPPARRVFELLLSYDCNAKCGFCYNPPLTPSLLAQDIPFPRAAAMLARARAGGYDGVWFTGGEPTLRPDLQKLLLLSRKLGFTRIQVATNAVRLAKPEYARGLVRAGMNYARISLHSATAEIHDKLLVMPGSFDKAVRAIEHLRELGVYVGLNFVVTRLNVQELPAFFELCLGRFGVRDFDVIFLHHRGMMESNAGLGIRYADAAVWLRRAWKAFDRHGLRRRTPTLINIPPCVAPELAPWVADWSVEPGADLLARPESGAMDLHDMKQSQRVKADSCRRCALDPQCMGFERDYAALYGTADFAPIARGGKVRA